MKIEVTISECLSSTQTIEVPDDFEYDEKIIKQIVEDTIVLPSDCLRDEGYYNWDIDDLSVLL